MLPYDVHMPSHHLRLIAFCGAGKLNRGMSVVDTVEILKGSDLTEAEYLQSAILGWGIELVSWNSIRIFNDMLILYLTSFKHTSSSQTT